MSIMKKRIKFYYVALVVVLTCMCICKSHAGGFATDAKNDDITTLTGHSTIEVDVQPYEHAILYLWIHESERHASELDRKNIENAASIYGNNMQILRIMCWITENDSEIRKMLICQWMCQLKYEGKLPSKESLLKFMSAILKRFVGYERNKRTCEIIQAYDNLPDVMKYRISENQIEFCVKHKSELIPFMSKKYKLGSVLFAGRDDDEYICDIYKKSRRERTRNHTIWGRNNTNIIDSAMIGIGFDIYELHCGVSK